MAIKSNPCKLCQSTYHTAAFCPQKSRKPLQRTAIKKTLSKSAKRVKKATRSQLIKKLDTVFSQYIRLKYSVDGLATCVTCGDEKPWKYQQNGHYMSRGNYATRWDETNCHVQCAACNVFKKGNYTEYAIFMIEKYGADKLTELKLKANKGKKFTSVEIQEMIEKYTILVQKYLQP